MTTSSAKTRGVTLLELMTVVAIIGITVGLSAMSYDAAAKKQRGVNAAREMMSEMQRARKLALTSGQPIRFVIKDVTIDGTVHRIARWEKLPCADSWCRNYPLAACNAALCSDNFMGVPVATACTCNEVGSYVEIPNTPASSPDMTVDWEAGATEGICFEPGTGTAHLGWRCNIDPDAGPIDPTLTGTEMRILIKDQDKRYLMVDGVTGGVRLHDCGAHDQSSAPAGGCP